MNFPLHLQTVKLPHQCFSLFVPDAEAVKEAYQSGGIAFPYWSKVWPAAIGLSEFLWRHPSLIQNKKVLETGAGLGLPSLMASRAAASVLCTDAVPDAVDIVRQSAMYNGLQNFRAAVMDWRHLPDDFDADVLLLSDVNYEPAAFAELHRVIESLLSNGIVIVLSTPQRLVAKEFISPLLQHCTQQEEIKAECEGEAVPVTVLVLEGSGR